MGFLLKKMAKAETIKHLSAPTIDPERILYHVSLSKVWWNKESMVNVLYVLNPLRIPWVVDTLSKTGFITKEKYKGSRPLEGLHILDAGCGGGFASEAFAELGATVVGLDPVAELIDEAIKRQLKNPSLKNITYVCGLMEDHFEKNREKYDVLFISQVLVHVKNRELFLQMCTECLKPGGHVFITALNKTWWAWLLYVVFYQNIIGGMTSKIFSYDTMIPFADVENWLQKYNCRTLSIRGYYYNHFYKRWDWSRSTLIDYALHAIKDKS